jgi:hypothetical protein
MARMERKEINETDMGIQNTCSEEEEDGDGFSVLGFSLILVPVSVSDSVPLLLL